MRSKLLQIILSVAVLLVLLGWIAGWFHSKVGPEDKVSLASHEQIAESTPAKMMTVPTTYEAMGTVHSRIEVNVSPRIQGTLRNLYVKEGDVVRAGQLIAILDAPELTAATYSAAGQVDSARSALLQAKRDLARYEELHNRGMISRQLYEQAKTSVEVAEGNLSSAQGGAGQAGSMAAYTQIHAPISGVVAAKYLEVGAIVGPGTPIILLHDPTSLRLEAAVDEAVAQRLHTGETITIQVDATSLTLNVPIEEILPRTDQFTRTTLIRASLPDGKDLRPGMFGRMLLPTGEHQGLFIPISSVRRVGALDTVHVIEEGRLETRYVRLGDKSIDGTLVEVLSGLKANDHVVNISASKNEEN